MSLTAAMQYLQVLEQSGLVTSRKVGRTRTCSTDTGALGQAEQWIGGQRSGGENCLGDQA